MAQGRIQMNKSRTMNTNMNSKNHQKIHESILCQPRQSKTVALNARLLSEDSSEGRELILWWTWMNLVDTREQMLSCWKRSRLAVYHFLIKTKQIQKVKRFCLLRKKWDPYVPRSSWVTLPKWGPFVPLSTWRRCLFWWNGVNKLTHIGLLHTYNV